MPRRSCFCKCFSAGPLPPSVSCMSTARSLRTVIAACVLASAITQCHSAHGQANKGTVDFTEDIQPLLAENCFACHGPDAAHREGELRLDEEAAAKDHVIVPGDPAASELMNRITTDDADLRMPPASSGKSLKPEQIRLIERWISEGAEWSQHWAFVAPKPQQPPSAGLHWARTPVDHFVFQRMAEHGLTPSLEADRRTLLRRVYLDLIGLPPTPEDLDRFLADTSDDAYEKVVDKLLADPHYGERVTIDWLDAARYADTNGYQNDFYRSMWPWRDWVIKALNDNLPYDQFILQQMAGDMLENPTQDQLIATGFSRNHRMVTEGGSIEEEWAVENVVDRVETTSTTLLGLTMGCSRCHDHKYDPITQKEFYEFFAFFNNVDEKGVYIETRGNVPPLIQVPTAENIAKLKEFDDSIADLEQLLAKAQADATDPKSDDAAIKDLTQRLETARKERGDYDKSVQTTMIMRDRAEYRPTYLLRRGQYNLQDTSQELWPAIPGCLPPMKADQPKNRLGLARWLIDRDNPLVARVAVNHVWKRLFGKGLFSADNVGVQGTPPSHPLLLDWLAIHFVDSGWDLKGLHKLIVMSATYRQKSDYTADLLANDPENRWLARGARFRLPAELIRDNALAVSGLLNPAIGGPSARPYQPAGLWEELAGGANDGPYKPDTGDGLYRRSLYTYRKRTVSHPTLSTFDAPSWEICQVKRGRTNTPLQSLALLNDVTYVEAARQLATRMIHTGGDTSESRITRGFRLALLREPTAEELAQLVGSFDEYSAYYEKEPAAASELIRIGDSAVAEDIPASHLAAMTAIASVLLNLDETMTRE